MPRFLRLRSPLAVLLLLGGLGLAVPARAQMDSREGIALQNQILQLRAELDALRRSGGGGGGYAPPVQAPRGGPGTPNEVVLQLLDRVSQLEDQVRSLRGRADEAENRNRVLQQQVEKLQGDMDYRLGQLEGRGGAAAAAPPPPREAPPPAREPADGRSLGTAPAASAAPRTPERAIADGRAALGRGDYNGAEAAAREANGRGARSADAQMLLGEALLGKRDYQNAAVAFDDAYRRNRQGARAPEALIGLANSFLGFGAKREACDTLGQLQTEFPRLGGGAAQAAASARGRAGCR